MTAAALALSAYGVSLDLPPGWEARAYMRDGAAVEPTARAQVAHPVVHVANFALPPGRGDFGTGAVERMGPWQVFVSIVEYGPQEVGSPLFGHRGVPLPRAREFSASALQRRLAGQGGWQRFFTVADRAFCVYIVLGSLANAAHVVPTAATVVAGVNVGPR